MYDTGNPNLKCYGNLEGWDGEERGGRLRGKGTYMYLWLIHVDVWQKLTQYCKAIMLQLKIFKSVKNYVPDI